MALIKCSECGKEISDKAKQCPYCGVENNVTFCPECGKQLNDNVVTCPSCGCPIKEVKQNNSGSTETSPLCLAGMVTGIVSFFIDFFGLVSAAGLIISIVGVTKANNSKNKTFAIVGIICSGIELVLKVIQLINLISLGYLA